MHVTEADCRNLEKALSLEWLETNGRGGFSSGTVSGANTRRYHALLLTARTPPTERYVLVSQLEEWLDLNGTLFPLSTNCYSGAIHPAGYQSCTGFSTDPWPTWTYDCGGTTIQREVLVVHGRDLSVIRWTLLGKRHQGGTLLVKPKLTGRDYHAVHHENEALSTEASISVGSVTWQMYPDVPSIRAFHSGEYRHGPQWYRRVRLPIEQQRGLDYQEDWWSPGTFTLQLNSDSVQAMAFTSEQVTRVHVDALLRRERTRRAQLVRGTGSMDLLVGSLWRAAHVYASERQNQHTILAGYPWFTDWGRDAFISLPGLCLHTGHMAIAWEVIGAFSEYVSEGMIPNRFPDKGDQPDYHAIDASLWFIYAVGRYLTASHDKVRVRQTAWPAIRQILDWYRHGTRFGIRMEKDGLITGGLSDSALTWMDVRIDGDPVTPRRGKPVEVQALWIHALEVGAALGRQFADVGFADQCRADRTRAVASFQERFWYQEGGYLYDVIDGPEGDDATLRPNQLFALSLVDDLVPSDRAQQILRLTESRLLTPVGLRTLSSGDSRYAPRCEGSVRQRDTAYHQGTVWPFLLGPFITAWTKAFGRSKETTAKVRGFLAGIEAHLHEACLEQISEIFDADPPHQPRGCYAQAWSVAEPLRALIEDLEYPTSTKSSKHALKSAARRNTSKKQASVKTRTPSKKPSPKRRRKGA